MRLEKREVEIFIAKDGKEFLNREDCSEYEKELASKAYFKVLREFDTVDGRGYQTTEFYEVKNWDGYHDLLLDSYLVHKNGILVWVSNRPVQSFVMERVEKSEIEKSANIIHLDFTSRLSFVNSLGEDDK